MPNKRIKILYTIPNFDTAGTGKAMLKIIERLDQQFFEPHIACNHDRGDFFKVVKDSGVPIHLFPTTTSMKNKWKGILKCWKMRKFYREHDFDLVHSFHYSDDYSEALSVRFAGKKWVYVKKNMNWGGNGWKMRTWLAHGILVQNPTMMEMFFKSNSKATLCFRGVDTSEFFPQPPQDSIIQEFGLTPQTKVILLVANLVPLKGVEFLFQAMEKVSIAPSEDIRIFIVGDDRNDYAKELKIQASHSRFPIVFTGKRMDISAFHSIATLFVFPSLKEGFGVSLLEALASGTYSIGSDIPGIRDQLKDFPNQLFPKGDVALLATKIQEALHFTKEELQEKVDQQLAAIHHGLTIEDEVARHEAFYKKILSLT
jgi:glycosyltransferase involved in cell wall biosynthesis